MNTLLKLYERFYWAYLCCGMAAWVVGGVLIAWTYVADNGVQAWTDDPDRIPAKHVDQAERVEVGDWIDYPKLSVVDSEAEED